MNEQGQMVSVGSSNGSAGQKKAPIAGIIPRKCPMCGAQTRDPFRGTIVIHDIFRCTGPSLPNTQGQPTPHQSHE